MKSFSQDIHSIKTLLDNNSITLAEYESLRGRLLNKYNQTDDAEALAYQDAGVNQPQDTGVRSVAVQSGANYAQDYFGVLSAVLGTFALAEMIEAVLFYVKFSDLAGTEGIPRWRILVMQIAFGAISAGIAFAFAFVDMFGVLPYVAKMTVALVQVGWWIAGVVVITWFGSFTLAYYNLGYFGAWFSFITALFSYFFASRAFFVSNEGSNNTAMAGARTVYLARYHSKVATTALGFASLVEMGAAIPYCTPIGNCNGYNAWAITLGVVSLFICLVLLGVATVISERVFKGVAAFLIVWWAVGGACVSYGDSAPFSPFYSASSNGGTYVANDFAIGNGAFACIAAVVAAIWLYTTLPPLLAPRVPANAAANTY